jgi:hypothetical protein
VQKAPHLYSNGAKGTFNSTAKIFIGGVVLHRHSTLDITPQGNAWVVRSGLCGGHANGARNVAEPWPIQWLTKYSFIQNAVHRQQNMCVCPIVLQPRHP